MAWNTPGGKGGDGPDNHGRGPWPPRGGSGGGKWGGLPGPLKDLFGDGGGIGRWILGAVVLLLLLFSSFQLIGEQQRGVVLRFGQFSRILQPGPNFKLPWPIETVRKVDATRIKTFDSQLPVLTGDENIVNVSLNVQYRVEDPRTYVFGARNADLVLEQAAQSAVREQIGRSDLNTVLNNRGPMAVAARERLQAALKAYHTGLIVTGLTLPDARPPEEVKSAFDEVNGAQQVKERLINEAQAYAAKVVPGGARPGGTHPHRRRRLQGSGDRPRAGRRRALHPAAAAVPERAGGHPQAAVAGDRAAGAGGEPQGHRRRRPPADLRADAGRGQGARHVDPADLADHRRIAADGAAGGADAVLEQQFGRECPQPGAHAAPDRP